MGKYFFDQYSYLHFASGIIAYFWNISFKNWILLHTIFEIIENTNLGIYIINNYITFWPGGKNYKDTLINSISDSLFAFIGWLSAYYLDKIGNKFKWFSKHLN